MFQSPLENKHVMVREGVVAESLLQKVKIELYIISMHPELFSV